MESNMEKTRERAIEIVVILLVFLVANVASQVWQTPISHGGGKGWDGVIYFEVAKQFSEGKLPQTLAPYVYRVGIPFLVALFFKGDLLLGFKVINVVGNLITTILLVLWLRPYIDNWKLRALLVTLFLIQWHGPVRFVYFYPALPDPWLFPILLVGLIGIQRIASRPGFVTICGLGLVAFVGVLVREVAFVIPVALLFATNPIPPLREALSALTTLQISRVVKRPPIAFLIPLAFGALGFLVARVIASQTNAYSFLYASLDWAYKKQLLAYLHAWFIAYGPVIALLVYNWRRVFAFLSANQYLCIYLLAFAVLAWIGGAETERYLFWAMPVVYLLVGISMEEHGALLRSIPLAAVLIVSQAISQRLFWTIPNYPNEFPVTPIPVLTIPSSRCQLFDLYAYAHGDRGIRLVRVVSFLQYLSLGGLLLWWLGYRAGKAKPVEHYQET